MIICSTCKVSKEESEFYKRNARKKCKACCCLQSKQSRLKNKYTAKGYEIRVWSALNTRTVNGLYPQHYGPCKRYLDKGVKLEFTRYEWHAFVMKNAELIEAIYAAGGTPSVDRINSYGHYSLDNIRIIPMRENHKLGVEKAKTIRQERAAPKKAAKMAKRQARAERDAYYEANGLKRCCTCKTDKSVGEFNKDRTTWDGFQAACRICTRETKAKHRIKRKQSCQ